MAALVEKTEILFLRLSLLIPINQIKAIPQKISADYALAVYSIVVYSHRCGHIELAFEKINFSRNENRLNLTESKKSTKTFGLYLRSLDGAVCLQLICRTPALDNFPMFKLKRTIEKLKENPFWKYESERFINMFV